MARYRGQYVPPGVYVEEQFEDPTQGTPQNVRIPVIVGTGNETLTRTDLAVVRGSSSYVDNEIPEEDETGRAVVNITQTGQVVLGNFNGSRRLLQTRNFPIVDGSGSGTLATSTNSVRATINGEPIVVLSIFDAEKGVIELSTAPNFGDDVRVTYFINRSDTLTTDDVSEQVTETSAVIQGRKGQPVGGFLFDSDTQEFSYRVDGDVDTPVTGTFGLGAKNAATVTSLINGASSGTSLTASIYIDNFGREAIQLTADSSLEILDAGSNTILGFTPGTSTNRRTVFHVFNRPIVVGDNGGVTTTDPTRVEVRVNNQIVEATAVDGQFGAVTLPFAPAVNSQVLITYFFNAWQDTFDYLANINVTDIQKVGIVPGNSDFIESADFVLKNNQIHWGTSVTVSEGVTSTGSEPFDSSQVSTLLVDQKAFLELTTAVVNTSVSPPVESRLEFTLPFQPTTGNGRNSPLGLEEFNKVANGRTDLPTNNPNLVQAYWGFDLQDAIERGSVEVVDVSGTVITLKDEVPVGAQVWATFYYNTITDAQYTLESETEGPSGIGTYFIKDRFSNLLVTPKFGTKGPALTGVQVEFPSGSELTPDVRYEGGSSGPVEETVSIQFVETDGTLAKYTVPGFDPYYLIEDASDRARFTIDNIPLAGGVSGIDLTNPNGIGGLGFAATLLGEEIDYDVDSGLTTYDVLQGVNDNVTVEIDNVLVNTTVTAQSGVNVSAYVNAMNATAKLAEFSPYYDGTTRFLGTATITAGEYDQFKFNYTGNTTGTTGPVTVTVPAGIYTSPNFLATAVNTGLNTAISALPAAFDGLDIGVSANANGQMRFTFKGADADLGTFASGTITVVAPPRFETVEIGGVTLTADLSQDSGGFNFNNGSARVTIETNGVRSGDILTFDVGGGPVNLTAAGAQTPGGLNFDEGDPAIGSVECNGVLPGDTVTIGGITLTASGAQTPGGLDFNEGTRSSGDVTLTGVLYGDVVFINGVGLTAGNTQTPGGLDFNAGTKASNTVELNGVRLGDTLNVNGTVYTAATTQVGGAYDFNAGTPSTATATLTGVRLGDTLTIGAVTLTANTSRTPGNLDFNAGTPSTGSYTVVSFPSTATITIDGIALTPAGGPRTSGNDDYDNTLGSQAAIAAEIVAAINDPNNSFTNTVSSAAVGAQVNLTAVTPGVAGDAITTISSDGTITAGAATLSGGIGDDDTAATSLDDAINDVLNGLSNTATSVVALNVVTLTAVTPGVAGDSINFVTSAPARFTLVAFAGGIGDDDTAAASLVAALSDALNVPTPDEVAASAVDNLVTLEAVVPGAVGNLLTLAASTARFTLGALNFFGGVGDDITAASSLVAAISDAGNGLVGVVLADNTGGTSNVVDLLAFVPGVAGDLILLSSPDAPRIVVSGANLTGGVGDDTTVAVSLAAAISDVGNGLTLLVTAGAVADDVNLTAVTPGNNGNLITLVSSSSIRLTTSGLTLSGGIGTNISVASSIAAAINDLGNGLSLAIQADNAGGASNEIDVWAVTPGVLGNSFTQNTTAPARLLLSGINFTGGLPNNLIASSLVAAILDVGNGLETLVEADNSSGVSNVVDVTALVPGPNGNLITLATSDPIALAISGASLTGGIDLPGGYFEFIDADTSAQDFSILAGISTDELPGESQTKILDADIARRFTVSGTSGRLIYDRIVLRNRIIPGSGSLHAASQVAQTQLEIQGNNAISETGLRPRQFGLAGVGASVRPATMFGEVGFVNGQVASGTYGDERDGQPLVRFYAEGGVSSQNNVFKANIDGIPFTVVFKDASGVAIPFGSSADVPLGPVSIANTVLNQIRSSAVLQGLDPAVIVQEGAGSRLVSQRDDTDSAITIGTGNANDTLGYADGATASRTSVEARKVASALMAHAGPSVTDIYLDYQNPVDTWFAAQGLAFIETDSTGAEYLFIQSQANNVNGLGTSSNLALLSPSFNSWLLTGTGVNALAGDGATGEPGVIGFYVTSSDPIDGSGSANTSEYNSGVGQDGEIGQTYRDSKTGLTFTILERADGGSYPTGLGATFTFEARNLVLTDANLPINTIPGIELTVSNTTGVVTDNTALVETFEKGGNEPAVGDLYYVTYDYLKNLTNPVTLLFSEQRLVEEEYGPADPDHPVSLGAKLAFQNGAQILGITQVPKEPNSNQASVDSYLTAFESLEGRLPSGQFPSTITPLRGDSLDLFLALKRHCDIQSSPRYRSERTALVGVSAGTQPTEVAAISQNINSRRIQLVYPDIALISSTDAFGNVSEYLIDSTFLACCEAGGRANPAIDVATPRDRKQIFGIRRILRNLKEVQKDTLGAQGVTLYEQIGNVIRVRESLTTTLDQSNIFFRIPQVTTSVDETKRALRRDLDRFIGRKKFPSTLTEVKGQATETLKTLKRQGILTNYGNVVVTEDPLDQTVYRVRASISPVFPLLVIDITLTVRASLEAVAA